MSRELARRPSPIGARYLGSCLLALYEPAQRLDGAGFCGLEGRGVALINPGSARIHARGQRRSRRVPPVLEFVDDVVVKVVQELQAVIAYRVGLLGDRSRHQAA